MTDPKRWLDDGGGATLFERDLLRDGMSMDPPEGAQKHAWAALLLRIDAGGGGAGGDPGGGDPGGGGLPGSDLGLPSAGLEGAGAAAAPAAGALSAAGGLGAAAAAGGGILKAALLGVACAGVVVAGYSAVVPDPVGLPADERAEAVATAPVAPGERHRGDTPGRAEALEPSAPAVAVTSAASAAATPGRDIPKVHGSAGELAPGSPPEPASVGQDPASPAPEAAGSAAPSGGAEPTVTERASRLREESLLLGQARDALRGGNAGEALRLLEVSRTRFPDGMLGQEREALTIEALARGGNRAAASARAAAFVRAYPQSPHAQRVQAFVQ
jgi:hypothetical protein